MPKIERRRGRVRIGSILMLAFVLTGCGRPAQIGRDEAVFRAVDALYTAVSLREPAQLDRCSSTLTTLHKAGRLPDGAAKTLNAMIAEARSGQWVPAQQRLADFMRGQRR